MPRATSRRGMASRSGALARSHASFSAAKVVATAARASAAGTLPTRRTRVARAWPQRSSISVTNRPSAKTRRRTGAEARPGRLRQASSVWASPTRATRRARATAEPMPSSAGRRVSSSRTADSQASFEMVWKALTCFSGSRTATSRRSVSQSSGTRRASSTGWTAVCSSEGSSVLVRFAATSADIPRPPIVPASSSPVTRASTRSTTPRRAALKASLPAAGSKLASTSCPRWPSTSRRARAVRSAVRRSRSSNGIPSAGIIGPLPEALPFQTPVSGSAPTGESSAASSRAVAGDAPVVPSRSSRPHSRRLVMFGPRRAPDGSEDPARASF